MNPIITIIILAVGIPVAIFVAIKTTKPMGDKLKQFVVLFMQIFGIMRLESNLAKKENAKFLDLPFNKTIGNGVDMLCNENFHLL